MDIEQILKAWSRQSKDIAIYKLSCCSSVLSNLQIRKVYPQHTLSESEVEMIDGIVLRLKELFPQMFQVLMIKYRLKCNDEDSMVNGWVSTACNKLGYKPRKIYYLIDSAEKVVQFSVEEKRKGHNYEQ